MLKRILAAAALAILAAVPVAPEKAQAGHMEDGGSGRYVNLIVREVKVTPIRAHVGDLIRIEMVVEDQGDPYYANRNAEILANGKVVARKLETYGLGGEGGRIRRTAFLWDTRGVKPGEYRIRGELFDWEDASPFDNFLDVKQPVVLLPPGARFPDGKPAGGTALARDPRYVPHEAAKGPGGPAPGGY